MEIKCTICKQYTEAEMVTGEVIYPHRKDLYEKKFWQCPVCKGYVGTHPDGKPLGSIVSKEIKKLRIKIHRYLDELWRDFPIMARGQVYKYMSDHLGKPFHTAEIEDVETAKRMLVIAESLNKKAKRKVGL